MNQLASAEIAVDIDICGNGLQATPDLIWDRSPNGEDFDIWLIRSGAALHESYLWCYIEQTCWFSTARRLQRVRGGYLEAKDG